MVKSRFRDGTELVIVVLRLLCNIDDVIVIMLVWNFLEYNFEKWCLLIYKRQFSNAEWSTVIDAKFPERVPLTDIHTYENVAQIIKFSKLRIMHDSLCFWFNAVLRAFELFKMAAVRDDSHLRITSSILSLPFRIVREIVAILETSL